MVYGSDNDFRRSSRIQQVNDSNFLSRRYRNIFIKILAFGFKKIVSSQLVVIVYYSMKYNKFVSKIFQIEQKTLEYLRQDMPCN